MQTETNFTASPTDDEVIAATLPKDAGNTEIPSGISREFHNFLADLGELVSRTTALTGADLSQAQKHFGEQVTAARQSVEALGNEIDQQARKSATVTNEYVHAQPWNAVGIGVGVGFLLGLLLARRV